MWITLAGHCTGCGAMYVVIVAGGGSRTRVSSRASQLPGKFCTQRALKLGTCFGVLEAMGSLAQVASCLLIGALREAGGFDYVLYFVLAGTSVAALLSALLLAVLHDDFQDIDGRACRSKNSLNSTTKQFSQFEHHM